MFYSLENGHTFSVEERVTDANGNLVREPCFDDNGNPLPDEKCNIKTQKREAFVDELTDAQMRLLFQAKEQRKKMRQEDSGVNRLKQQHGL